MNTFEKTIRDTARTTELSQESRARMRARVLEYVAYKPIRQPFRVSYTFVYAHAYRAVSALLIVLFLIGGVGTAYASEGALPGDALYGVKQATEKARETLALSQEARISWNIERTERRINEARALALRGALTAERDAYLAEQIKNLHSTIDTEIMHVEQTNAPLAQALALDLDAGTQANIDALERTQHAQKESAVLSVARERVPRDHTSVQAPPQEQPEVVAVRVVVPTPIQIAQLKVEKDQEQQEDTSALERIVARQQERLQKESKKVEETRQQEARATIRAIAEMQKYFEESSLPENGNLPKRAFLEATLYEVHEARVRLKVTNDMTHAPEDEEEIRAVEDKDAEEDVQRAHDK